VNIEGSVALVTGANRGLGAAFAQALLDAGAAKVYGAARDPGSIAHPGVIPLRLDVTNPADIAQAVRDAGDVTLLVNNAGISTGSSALGPDAVELARLEMETNFFGPLQVSRAFAPVLASNGGGGIVNVLSVLSWLTFPAAAMYAASKAASWSLTNALRLELHEQGTLVVGVHCGFLDTDMAAAIEAPKTDPAEVARAVLAAVEADAHEVLADDTSTFVRSRLSDGVDALYPSVTRT